MDRSGGEGTIQTSDARQGLGASFIGTAIEWYDFLIYRTAAAALASINCSSVRVSVGSLLPCRPCLLTPSGMLLFYAWGSRIARRASLVVQT